MKTCFRLLTAAALTGALLGWGGALAAGESAVTVQLDGQELTFTDAVPQVRDQRTFLPFRAVFEAMGAQVSNEGSVITATRDGRTLTMTLGETSATVTEGDVTTSITMDTAPYVDNTTWRTYVPVRFAAQAFGCAVGWDQTTSTAIIVDTGKVVASALEGKSFTYLEKLTGFSEKYNRGIWDVEATVEANMGMQGLSVPMSGSMKGTVEDGERLSMEFGLMTPISLRGDVSKGKLYMNRQGEDWYRLDMAALAAGSGMDWAGVMGTSKSLNCAVLAEWALSSLTLSDSATAYDQVKERVEQALSNFSDEGFVREEDRYTAAVAFEDPGAFSSLILVVEMKGDAVTGYVMSEAAEAGEDGVTVSADRTVSMNDKDQMTAEIHMDMGGVTMDMTMAGSYAPGKTAPETEPPAGAKVADFMAGTPAFGV